MYIKKICIQNYGPLANFNVEMPFNVENGEWSKTPQPLIIVGPNGTGKTIILSHIINSFLTAKAEVYDDGELKKGTVFKTRSPSYIKDIVHNYYHYSRIDFDNNDYSVEFQLNNIKRKILEKDPNFIPPNNDWNFINEDNSDLVKCSFWERSKALEVLDKNVLKYFPADRTDKPAWENNNVTLEQDDFQKLSEYSNISNRQIVSKNEFELNRKWLLDIIFDSLAHTSDRQPVVSPVIYDLLNKVLNAIYQSSKNIPVRFAVSDRHHRRLELVRQDNGDIVLPNITQLSLGQSLLLNLFLSIIRDVDNSKQNLFNVSDISGIVLIDEIENHLHNELIVKVLPQLIKLFPKIQFIITSHSPMFLLGMQNTFNDKFKIIELNSETTNGYEEKTAEQFSEFKKAFKLYENTNTFFDQIKNYQKPILITEGKTDETLIRCAWNALYSGEEFPFDFMGFPSETSTRGAPDLNCLLRKIGKINGKKIIGLFDSDETGIIQHNGLLRVNFCEWEQNRDVLIKENSIFAACLPIPPSKDYMRNKPDGSGFEIEDYFPESLLEELGKGIQKCNYIENQDGGQIPDTDKPTYIKFKGNKTKFATQVESFNNDDGRFNDFKLLFERLLEIVNH